MTKENQQIHITSSGSYTHDCTGKQGTLDFVVDGGSDVYVYCFVYDADVAIRVLVQSSHTKVYLSAIVVSASDVKSSLDISGHVMASHSSVDIYALSLLGDNAKAVVNGGVVIAPDIVKAEGYLSEENILLGKKISIKSLPMLDVRSNDVKASHGAKIDRLDAQKIFYLTAKGLPVGQAERLMTQSYIQKALDHASVSDSESIIEHIFSIL